VHAGIHSLNSAPLLNLGWWFDVGRLFLDVRLSQIFAIASWSSIPHAVPGLTLVASPLPGISPWLPIGLVEIGIHL
jgi:hypothetical protein